MSGTWIGAQAEKLAIGVVVEKRASRSRWAAARWKPVSVFAGGHPGGEDWQEMRSGDGWVRYYAGTTHLDLHRSAAEDYKRNLSSPRPAVYVVLTAAAGDIPWRLHSATVSPYDGEAYMVSSENLVEAVPMPEDIAAVLAEFAEVNFRPEKFRKRQRDVAPSLVEETFGKQPIFARNGRSGGGRNG